MDKCGVNFADVEPLTCIFSLCGPFVHDFLNLKTQMSLSLPIIPTGLKRTLSCNYHIFENVDASERGCLLSEHAGRRTNKATRSPLCSRNLIASEIVGHPLTIIVFRASHFWRQIQEHRKPQEPKALFSR